MPFPRPAARPWSGFFGLVGLAEASDDERRLRALVRKAHAAERAAAIAYRGHRACFRDAHTRALIHGVAMDEWRHRAWLRRRCMPALDCQPAMYWEIWFAGVGAVIALACLLIGPFVATYFAGRLERDNGAEYADLAAGLRRLLPATAAQPLVATVAHMEGVERRHERQLLALIRQHRWLPAMAAVYAWPGHPQLTRGPRRRQAQAPAWSAPMALRHPLSA